MACELCYFCGVYYCGTVGSCEGFSCVADVGHYWDGGDVGGFYLVGLFEDVVFVPGAFESVAWASGAFWLFPGSVAGVVVTGWGWDVVFLVIV